MGNESLVEGPWGKYTFHKVRPEDVEKVIKHIKDYFLRDEPTSQLIGYTDEYGEEHEAITRKFILDGLSFWAQDNETGDVAAVRMTLRNTKDMNFDEFSMNSPPLKELKRIYDICHEGCDLYQLYNVEEYAEFFVASCAPKYRRQGLTTELYKRSLSFLAAEGYKMAESVFTSPHSRAAARKLGFEEIFRVNYKDVKDEDGNPVFDPNTLNEEHYAAVLCKRL